MKNKIIDVLQVIILGTLVIYLVIRYAKLGWLIGH